MGIPGANNIQMKMPYPQLPKLPLQSKFPEIKLAQAAKIRAIRQGFLHQSQRSLVCEPLELLQRMGTLLK